MTTTYGNDPSANATSGDTSTSSRTTKGERKSSRSTSEEVHGVDLRKYLDEAKSLGQRLDSQMSTHPYAVLGAVAGTSFLAGALLGSRIGRFTVAIGLGYAATRFAQENDLDLREVAKKAVDRL